MQRNDYPINLTFKREPKYKGHNETKIWPERWRRYLLNGDAAGYSVKEISDINRTLGTYLRHKLIVSIEAGAPLEVTEGECSFFWGRRSTEDKIIATSYKFIYDVEAPEDFDASTPRPSIARIVSECVELAELREFMAHDTKFFSDENMRAHKTHVSSRMYEVEFTDNTRGIVFVTTDRDPFLKKRGATVRVVYRYGENPRGLSEAGAYATAKDAHRAFKAQVGKDNGLKKG